MLNQHPIIPPPELVQQWFRAAIREHEDNAQGVATRAAQWGADRELEACCEWMQDQELRNLAGKLRATRRPKPPSLKEQSLALIDLIQGNKKAWDIRDLDVVRRALEALPDD